jgi:type VI secretion system protein ImpA
MGMQLAKNFDFSRFLQPVSDDEPSGPDLELAGDGDFFNYTLPAENRLPSQYLDSTGKITFDRTALNLDGEVSEISALLERSRDLRLVSLLAQFGAAGLSLSLFAESLALMHGLLQEQWDSVHPQGEDGDFTMRKIAVEAMDDRLRVAIPLAYVPLVRSRSAGQLTFRACELAANPAVKRPVEEVLPVSTVSEAFKSADARAELETTSELVQAALAALRGIRALFIDKADYESVPQLPNTLGILEGIESVIRREAPELFGESPVSASVTEAPTAATGSAPAHAGPAPVAAAAPAPAAPLNGPKTHGEAASVLEDIEAYFIACEPSSPALLLAHQARKLIGRPLIEAVEALAGSRTDGAQIRLGQAGGFTLTIETLRQLSSTSGGGQPVTPVRREDQKPVENRAQAQTAMLGVEQFLAANEPSSPVPMLLAKAREMMGKDFSSLLGELLNSPKSDG